MTPTDAIMALANTYAASNGKALLERLYGTSQSYTEQRAAEALKDREALRTEVESLTRQLKHAELAAAAEADEVDRLKKERAYIRAAALEEAADTCERLGLSQNSEWEAGTLDCAAAIRALKEQA